MFGCFADPYPGELLYSVCARISDRMQFPNKKSLGWEMFGMPDLTAVVDLPCYIDHLVACLPPGHNYTADSIIEEHTLLPFYSPFISSERLSRLQMCMRRSGGHEVPKIFNARVKRRPRQLRYCPLCKEDDVKGFGEYYWHRLHQVSCVMVCPTHFIFLESVDIGGTYKQDRNSFYSAAKYAASTSPRPVSSTTSVNGILLRVARDVEWVLSQHNLSFGANVLRENYMSLLTEQGLLSHKVRLRLDKLIAAFSEHFPEEILELFDCRLTDSESWLLWLLRYEKTAQNPVRHLLLIQFLGYTAEEFLTLVSSGGVVAHNKGGPFGAGPWPCLNLAHQCGYRRLIISKCDITAHSSGGRPVGIFYCDCGFVYSRVGPDNCSHDVFRFDRVRRFGSMWDAVVTALKADPPMSPYKVSQMFGISSTNLRRRAVKLGILPPLPSERITIVDTTAQREVKLEAYRNTWLAAMEGEGSQATLTSLQRKFHTAYHNLKKYDPEWLGKHSPPRRGRASSTPRTDWASRDVFISAEIKAILVRLRQVTDRPIRISRALIIRELGYRGWSISSLDKLPLTAGILAEALDTPVKFAIRRIEWAADTYRQENLNPRLWQLRARAGVNHRFARHPLVTNALEQALKTFDAPADLYRQAV